MEYIVDVGRAALVVVFLVSAVSKFRSRAAFAEFLAAVPAVAPPLKPLALPAAVGTIGAEGAIVALLAVPRTAPYGFGLAVVLLAAFTVGLVGIVRRKVPTTCRCFGGGDNPVRPRHVVRNLVLIALALAGLGAALLGSTEIPLAGVLISFGAGGVLGAFVGYLDDLFELFAPTPARAGRR